MAGADASAYLSAVKWGDEVYYVREFVQKMKLPQVAKIIKGQFSHLGVPTLASPSSNQIVFLSSGGSRIKVAAQCVKFKEGRKVVPIGPKLAIPDNYQGWFEILSEDGRAVRGIESVAELAKRNPESCVVRDPVKALVSKTEDPDAVAEKSRTLQPGETLILVGEAPGSVVKGKNASGRYLRCLTSKNETIYLNLESKGRFSPVAGEENISGVHTIRNLLSKRLPLMARLVSGKPLSGSQFLPEMRLYSLFEEDCVMALPLLKDAQIVPLPSNVPLKLLAPKNVDVLVKLREYGRLNEKCQSLISGVSDQIRVFDISVSKELRNDVLRDTRTAILGGGRRFSHTPRARKFPHIRLIQRSLSDPQGTGTAILPVVVKTTTPGITPQVPAVKTSLNKEAPKEVVAPDDTRYDEIDQIYDYVRGFAPLPAKINSDFLIEGPVSRQSSSESTPATAPASPLVSSPVDKTPRCSPPATPPVVVNGYSPSVKSSITIGTEVKDAKPEPPPIETIPARKLSTTETVPPTMVTASNCARKAASVSVSLSSNKNSRREGKKEVNKVIKDVNLIKVNNSESEHIYEKLGNKRDEDARNNNLPTSPVKFLVEKRTDSGSNKKITLSSQRPRTLPIQVGPPSLPLVSATTTVSSNCNGNNSKKLFVKSPPQQRTQHKSRFFKHSKGNNTTPVKEPAMVHQIHQQSNQRCYHSPRQNGVSDGHASPVKSYLASNSSKSLGSSPLFNIRYKSLSNLAADFDTLDSSNSGGGQTTSSGSAGSKEHRPREPKILKRSRLPRPRSLTNLLWDISQVDSRNRYNLSKNGANREFIFPPNQADSKYASQTKAIGTLYL